VAFFVKENCGIPTGILEKDGKTFNTVEIIVFVSGVATASYYEDDGETNNYLQDDFFQIDFTVKKENNGTFCIQAATSGNRLPKVKDYNFVIVDENANITRQTFSL
jgi:alpha-glucosidase (family GH31 glycosyl hydrolase)